MRVAIMQPYFIPYAGYFCLYAAADIFVVFDTAQYMKGGYVNRNRLTTVEGEDTWLTLPLKSMPLDSRIMDMEFGEDAGVKWAKQLNKFKIFRAQKRNHITHAVTVAAGFTSPLQVISTVTRLILNELGFNTLVIKASTLPVDQSLRGQDRVIAICNYLHATSYVNASGGRDLYSTYAFESNGIELKILKPYEGNTVSIVERLALEKTKDVREEILNGVEFIS